MFRKLTESLKGRGADQVAERQGRGAREVVRPADRAGGVAAQHQHFGQGHGRTLVTFGSEISMDAWRQVSHLTGALAGGISGAGAGGGGAGVATGRRPRLHAR